MTVQAFIDEVNAVARNDRHGYSQSKRWGNPGFDCSSLPYYCAYRAGLLPNYKTAPAAGYSDTIVSDFTRNGWSCVEYDGNPYDLTPGDVIVRLNHGENLGHVAICVGVNDWVQASDDYDGKDGDSSGREIAHCKPYRIGNAPYDWDYVLTPPKTAQKPDAAPFIEIHTTDTGWTRIAGQMDAIRVSYANVQVDNWPVVPAGGAASDGDDYAGKLGTPLKKIVLS